MNLSLRTREREQNATLACARPQHEAAHRALDSTLRLLTCLKEAGASQDERQDLAALMLDMLSNVRGRIRRALDDDHIDPDYLGLDLGELEKKVKK